LDPGESRPLLKQSIGSLSYSPDIDNFTAICQIIADLSQIPVKKMVNPSGKVYYQVAFDVVLSFGLIEMTAQIAWSENVCHVFLILIHS
jgi:hypothetical protein